MKTFRFPLLLPLCLLWAGQGTILTAQDAAAADATPPGDNGPAEVSGRVTEVTLYRGQALVTRVVPIKGGEGSFEIVVKNLPENVVGDSLFAIGSDTVQVRAVRYRNRQLDESQRPELKAVDEALEAVRGQLAVVQKNQDLARQQQEYLNNLERFSATSMQGDVNKGVLDAEALTNLTSMIFKQRAEAAETLLEAQEKQRELQREQELLQRERGKLTTTVSMYAHEALLFIERPAGAADGEIELNYLVNNCGWSPSYNFRGSGENAEVLLEYNALIRQMSGEDWENVELTLSTASPSLSAASPALAPLSVDLKRPTSPQPMQQAQGPQVQLDGMYQRQQVEQLREQVKGYNVRQNEVLNQFGNTVSQSANFDNLWSLNVNANGLQLIELNNAGEVVKSLMRETQAEEQPSINYEIEGRVSLASRRDQQMVRILRTSLDSNLYYVATPLLSRQVYREAEVVNDSGKDFLTGSVNVYLDDRFVGRTEIPTVARGQTFVVGFGADPQLRTMRELVEREQKVQGGNQVLSFKYRVVIENYKDVAVPVRLMERIPFADDAGELRVTLAETSEQLSEDPIYLRLERPKGVLRWDIEVPANSSGMNAHFVNYSYNLEFDRNFILVDPASGQESTQLRELFNDIQNRKQRF